MESRWRTILICSAIVVAVLVIYTCFFGEATMFAFEARYLNRNDPSVWKTPVTLTEDAISPSPGRRLSYLGYEFEVPWTDLDEHHTKLFGTWQLIHFNSGISIVMRVRPPNTDVNLFTDAGKNDSEVMKRYWGPEILVSDYAFTKAKLESNPANVTLFTSRRDALRELDLLMLKSILLTVYDRPDSLFFVKARDFEGFQYGNPRNRPHEIGASLFGANGSIDFEFRARESGPAISQEEINRVIQTVHPVRP
jgi:hypothetical protein